MTEDDRVRLQAAIAAARTRAVRIGPQSALWGYIFDAETILEGKPVIVEWNTEELIRTLEGET